MRWAAPRPPGTRRARTGVPPGLESSRGRGWWRRMGVSLLIMDVLARLKSEVCGQAAFGSASGGAGRCLAHGHHQGGPLGRESQNCSTMTSNWRSGRRAIATYRPRPSSRSVTCARNSSRKPSRIRLQAARMARSNASVSKAASSRPLGFQLAAHPFLQQPPGEGLGSATIRELGDAAQHKHRRRVRGGSVRGPAP